MSDITVRVGTPDDLDAMMELCMHATQENALVEPDPEMLLRSVYPSLHLDKGVVGIIGAPGEKIEAAIMLRIGTLWYSSVPIIEERAIYVEPEFRSAKGGRAARLAEFAKKFATELDMVLAIGVLSSSKTEAKNRMYSRFFGNPSGTFFLWNGKTGLGTVAAE